MTLPSERDERAPLPWKVGARYQGGMVVVHDALGYPITGTVYLLEAERIVRAVNTEARLREACQAATIAQEWRLGRRGPIAPEALSAVLTAALDTCRAALAASEVKDD